MSHIFDALQRTGAEQSGVEYPDVMSVVTQVLEAPAEKTEAQPAKPGPLPVQEKLDPPLSGALLESALSSAAKELASMVEVAPASQREDVEDFPTIHVFPGASSRLVFATQPEGLAAEKFRFLGVRLRQLQKNRPLKKILITSTIPEEGKSLIAANLAGVLGRRKQRVLLIDGDLRRPVLAEQLGLGKLAGLAEWLGGDRKKLPNIYRLEGLDFWIMPAGEPPVNPLEMMSSGSLGQLLERLSTMFDWIIVDSPPVLPLADTSVWMRVTDGSLLVARVGKTEKAQLQRGLEMLNKSEVLGVVLNGSTHADRDYYQRYSK